MRRFGVIDIGSNSVKLTAAECADDGAFEIIATGHRVPQLARALAEDGALDAASMTRTVDAIRDLVESTRHLELQSLRVVATQAVRAAPNQNTFIEQIRSRCGFEVEVLDPEREAGLSWDAVRGDHDVGDEPSVLLDVGGGSAECLFAEGSRVNGVVSLPLGALHLTERFNLHDRIDEDVWSTLCDHVRSEIETALPRPESSPYAWAVGGTCMALVELDRLGIGMVDGSDLVPASEPWAFTGLSCERMRCVLDQLRCWSLEERVAETGVDRDRAAILPAGACVVLAMLDRLGVSVGCCVTRHGVRDGLLRAMFSEG